MAGIEAMFVSREAGTDEKIGRKSSRRRKNTKIFDGSAKSTETGPMHTVNISLHHNIHEDSNADLGESALPQAYLVIADYPGLMFVPARTWLVFCNRRD